MTGIKLTYYGHATLGLSIESHKILIDPYFKGNPLSPFKPEEVDANYILVTHGHGDHIGDTVEIAKRCNSLVISNYEIADWLEKKGVRTHAQHLGGGHQHPFGYLKLTYALHGSALPDGSYGGNPAGLLLTTTSGKRLYFAGDTGLFGDMKLIGEEGLHLAVLPIGDNYTMGTVDALRAVKLLDPSMVIPIHFRESGLLKADARDWAIKVEKETRTKAIVLDPGQELTIE
jgi:L-ascorbate metabolism protein UlaG (beta-lactamase superfamily)